MTETNGNNLTPLKLKNSDTHLLNAFKPLLNQNNNKEINGKFFSHLTSDKIDKDASNTQITEEQIFPETESFVIAI